MITKFTLCVSRHSYTQYSAKEGLAMKLHNSILNIVFYIYIFLNHYTRINCCINLYYYYATELLHGN